ncbi:MAG: HD domain-containing protein [Clostridiales bacterium]|jgi:tRNA nucleotidyltransferase/poly(A) polymerase|nr:HD domain-containing protein [Clostridiales bacterium]
MNIVIPVNLKTLAKMFEETGHKLYVVGGYIRNAAAGLPAATDIDLASDVPSYALRGMLRSCRVVPVNKHLGTCAITVNNSVFEYTPFRTEAYGPGGAHRPVAVAPAAGIREDCRRRDFTCNALYYDVGGNKILDPFGGVADIQKKVMRAAVSPEHVFERDGLRLLRLARQSAEMGFTVDPDTWETAKSRVGKLADISPERKQQELEKMLAADSRYGVPDAHYTALQRLGELGAWPFIAPEVAAGIGLAQPPEYHKYDVYEHTLQTVRVAPPDVRLAALFHDVGKAPAVALDGNMHRHAELGAAAARARLGQKGLKYPGQRVNETVRLVRCHMYDFNGMTGIGKLRQFIAANWDVMGKLLALKRADILGAGVLAEAPALRIEETYRQMKEENCPVALSDLKIDGNDVKAVLPGLEAKQIGVFLHSLLEEVVMNPSLNTREWLLPQLEKRAEKTTDTTVTVKTEDIL